MKYLWTASSVVLLSAAAGAFATSSNSINDNMNPPRFVPNLAELERPTGRCIPQEKASSGVLSPDFREPFLALVPFTWSKDAGNIRPAGADGRNATSLCLSSTGDNNHCALCNGVQKYTQSGDTFFGGTAQTLISTFFPVNTMQRYTVLDSDSYFMTTPWSIVVWSWDTGSVLINQQIPAAQRAVSGQWYYSSTVAPQISNKDSILVFQEKAHSNGMIVEARALRIGVTVDSKSAPTLGSSTTVWTSGSISCLNLADCFTATSFSKNSSTANGGQKKWFVSIQSKKMNESKYDLVIIDMSKGSSAPKQSCVIEASTSASAPSFTTLPDGRLVALYRHSSTPSVAVLANIDSSCNSGKTLLISNFTSIKVLNQLSVSSSFVGMTSSIVADGSTMLVCTVSSSSGTRCSGVSLMLNENSAGSTTALTLSEEFGLSIISVANAIPYENILEKSWFIIQGGSTNKIYGLQSGQQQLAWTAPAVWRNLATEGSNTTFVPLVVQQVFDQVMLSPASSYLSYTSSGSSLAVLQFNGVDASDSTGFVVTLSCATGQYTSIRSAPGLGLPGTVFGAVNVGSSYDTHWNNTVYVVGVYTGVDAIAAALTNSRFLSLAALNPAATSAAAPATSLFASVNSLSISGNDIVQADEMLYVTNRLNKLTAVNLTTKAVQWASQGPADNGASVNLEPPLVESKDYLVSTFSSSFNGNSPKRHLIQIYERATGYTQTVDLSQQGGQPSVCSEVGVGRRSNFWSANYEENIFFTYSPHSVGCMSRIKVKKVSSTASAFSTVIDQFEMFSDGLGSGYTPTFFTVLGSELFFQLSCGFSCTPTLKKMMKISISASATWSKFSITKQPLDFQEDQVSSNYEIYTVVEAYGYLYGLAQKRLVCIEMSTLKPLWVAHVPTYAADDMPVGSSSQTPNYFWTPAGIRPFNGYIYVATTPSYNAFSTPTSSDTGLWVSQFNAKYDGQDQVGNLDDVGNTIYPLTIYTDRGRVFQSDVFDINDAVGGYNQNNLNYVRYFDSGYLVIVSDSGYTSFSLKNFENDGQAVQKWESYNLNWLYTPTGSEDTGLSWVLKFTDDTPALPYGLLGKVKHLEAKPFTIDAIKNAITKDGDAMTLPKSFTMGPASMYHASNNGLQKIYFKAGSSVAVISQENLINFYDVPPSTIKQSQIPTHQSTASASNAKQGSVPTNPTTPVPDWTFTPINFDDGDTWVIGPIFGGLAVLGGICFVILIIISRRKRAAQTTTIVNAGQAVPLNQQQPAAGVAYAAAPLPPVYGNQQNLGYGASSSTSYGAPQETQPLTEGAPSVQDIGGGGDSGALGVKEV